MTITGRLPLLLLLGLVPIVLRPERADLTAVALDLGAGDVLPADLAAPPVATEAAIRLEAQLARKREADQRRAETRRSVLWAMTDPLTGLYNRRYALPRLAEMLASARGRGAPPADPGLVPSTGVSVRSSAWNVVTRAPARLR